MNALSAAVAIMFILFVMIVLPALITIAFLMEDVDHPEDNIDKEAERLISEYEEEDEV